MLYAEAVKAAMEVFEGLSTWESGTIYSGAGVVLAESMTYLEALAAMLV